MFKRVELHNDRPPSPDVDQARASRLRQARIAADFASAGAVCRRFGWAYGTYSSHENGNRNIPLETVTKYAIALNVPAEWLAYGRGAQQRRGSRVRIEGYVAGNLEIRSRLQEAPDEIPDDAEAPTGVLPDTLHAWRFETDDDSPFYHIDDIIYTLREHDEPSRYVGEICVVLLADGRRMIRIVRAHLGGQRFVLSDFGHRAIEVDLVEAAPIAWVRHSRFADRKI
jgi:transcriptional regulator with XRE-family HTH domain